MADVVDEYEVTSLSGETLMLLSESEQAFYRRAQDRYAAQNRFTHDSDLRAVDRLVFLETYAHRCTTQISRGRDMFDNVLDQREIADLRKALKDASADIQREQEALLLTKRQRDEAQHDSVGSYIEQLLIAAKQHGVRREKQLGKALEQLTQIYSLCGAYRRSSEHERRKLGLENAEAIVDLILDVLKPEFDEIDAYFREHQQKFWLRKL